MFLCLFRDVRCGLAPLSICSSFFCEEIKEAVRGGLIRAFSGSGRNSFKASSHPLFIGSSGAPKGWNGRETIFHFSSDRGRQDGHEGISEASGEGIRPQGVDGAAVRQRKRPTHKGCRNLSKYQGGSDNRKVTRSDQAKMTHP